jgi:hypothetical protein
MKHSASTLPSSRACCATYLLQLCPHLFLPAACCDCCRQPRCQAVLLLQQLLVLLQAAAVPAHHQHNQLLHGGCQAASRCKLQAKEKRDSLY